MDPRSRLQAAGDVDAQADQGALQEDAGPDAGVPHLNLRKWAAETNWGSLARRISALTSEGSEDWLDFSSRAFSCASHSSSCLRRWSSLRATPSNVTGLRTKTPSRMYHA